MATWTEEIVDAMVELGNEASLVDIIRRIRERGMKKITAEASIRQALEDHCPQKSFRSGKAVFHHLGGERSGYYRLVAPPVRQTELAIDVESSGVPRHGVVVNRIVRDTLLATRIKELYNYRCQICATSILLPNNRKYAEAHHLQPLGGIHGGPDVAGNVMCVCPNHHVQLDYSAMRISVSALKISLHIIEERFVDYHNRLLARTVGAT